MNQMTLAGRTLLDATTGEGILAIAAAKLGTQRAIGIDINTQIVKVAKLNAELNRAQDETAFYAQDFAERLPMTEPLPDAVVLNLPPEDYLSIDALLANYPSIHTIILAGGARSAFPRPLDMGQKYIDMFHAHGFYFKTKFTDAIDRYRDGQVWDTYILEKLTQDHPAAAATAAKLSNRRAERGRSRRVVHQETRPSGKPARRRAGAGDAGRPRRASLAGPSVWKGQRFTERRHSKNP